ncbi:MAG: aminotransferase class I/II-fold pyridoxal phosphate-dependent enzyme, partial [Hyphomicrobiaceae bacterium]
LVAAFQVLLQPGDPVLCDALCYTGFRRIAHLRGVRLVQVAADAEGMQPDSLEEAVRESGARVLLANPVLQNPLATVQPEGRRVQIAAVCKRHDLKVIEDAISAPLADPGTPSLAALMPERTVHLAGWSKSIASGFRLGYALLPRDWRSSFQEAVLGAQWFAPGFFAELVEGMRQDGALEECMRAQRAEALARQASLRQWLPMAVAEGTGYHAWLPCGPGLSSRELCELAGNQAVSVSASHHFAADPEMVHPDGVRISLGACEDRAKLQQGLAVLSGLVIQARSGQRLPTTAPAV